MPPGKEETITLAHIVQQNRERVGLSQARLAELANLPLSQIQDIESGLELFLAPFVRQKLARVLKIRPAILKMSEKPPLLTEQQQYISPEAREQYIEDILRNPDETHFCPVCRSPLTVRLFNRRDLEDNLLVEVQAHCSKCLFTLS